MKMKLMGAVLTLLLMPLTASPQEEGEGLLNRLLAPGPLMSGHKDLEGSDCLKCHEAGKGISEAKCLDCHKEIKAEVNVKKGYHGLLKETCIQCHSDHKGRDYDSANVDEKKFDHNLTGYKLEGKHAELACVKCHAAKRTGKPVRPGGIRYLGAKTNCAECHRKDDIHHFRDKWAKFDCIKCHGLKSWKEDLTFDHDTDTKFKLEGKHAELKCVDCHKNGRYHWANLKSAQCLACHADFHKQNVSHKFAGGKCTDCHTQEQWKIAEFDHRVTNYPLRGKHKELQCAECHKQPAGRNLKEIKNFRWTGLKSDCLSCHKDFHKFGGFKSSKLGLLKQCLECHNERGWKDIHNFNHSTTTRFPVEGKHIDLDCAKCHNPQDKITKKTASVGKYHWENLSKATCEVCHASPHKNSPSPAFKNKKCDQCHVAEGWKVLNQGGKRFNHDNTRFKLTGAHEKISCSACHVVGKKEVYKFSHPDQQFCIDCHKNQHNDQFHPAFSAQSCVQCHNTKKFTEHLPFDHSKTSFVLKGKHASVKCEQCHVPTNEFFETRPPHRKSKFLFPEMAIKDCTSCHADYHNGQLGNKCASCHSESGWKPVRFDHNTQTKYPLQGKHIDVKCEKCHKAIPNQFVDFAKQRYPVILYKPISPECTSCHKDPHSGHFGARCQECHMDKGWKLTKDFHKNFSLSGVHYSLQCQECHRDNRQLAGMSQECILCHQKDDIHQGTLPQCGTCHKQQFWEDIDFKHSLTQFPLRGAHRTLGCADCHRNGVYQGLNNQCSDCHLQQAITTTVSPHSPISSFMRCQDCHNQFAF